MTRGGAVSSDSRIELMTATQLLAAFRAKSLSPIDAAQAALERIEKINSQVNGFCLVDEDRALGEARAAEQRWLQGRPTGVLDGVPLSVKDLLLTKGWPTLRGSRLISPRQDWSEDAPSVARLRENGAVFLGKTATPELGW